MATEEKPIGVNGTEGESVASHTHNHESPAQTSGVTPSYNDEMTTETHGRGTKYNGGLDEKEVGIFQSTSSQEAVAVEERPSRIHTLWVRHKIWVYVAFELLMTGWWIAGLVLHRHDLGWLIPFLLWLAITLRIITLYVPTRFILTGINFVWTNAVQKPAHIIPEHLRMWAAAAGTIAVFIIGTFASGETPGNTRGDRAVSLFGLVVFLAGFYITSRDRKMIQWQTVIVGMLAQFILALFVLRTKAGFDIFNFIAFLAVSLLGFAAQGTLFLTSQDTLDLHLFITGVVPPIIFFIAFVHLLYHWGWLQWFIKKFATIFFYTMKVSGAEAVVAAASPFVGQGESAMLIKPFIPYLTDAELHQVMTSGFATIAGSVLAVYIGLGISPLALISSCVMSIPASLAISKMRYPETEPESVLTANKITVPEDRDAKAANSLHAFANGSWLGIKIGGMIVACLLTILALLGLCNGLLGWWGHYLNIKELSVQLIVGYIFYPIAFLLGVSRSHHDLLFVGKLIGTKVVANEFVAFASLSTTPIGEITERTRLIATYAVCGFGNISSVGIQIGVLSQLAPDRAGRVAKVALSALISGVISTLTSAAIAGMLIVDASKYTTVGAPTSV